MKAKTKRTIRGLSASLVAVIMLLVTVATTSGPNQPTVGCLQGLFIFGFVCVGLIIIVAPNPDLS